MPERLSFASPRTAFVQRGVPPTERQRRRPGADGIESSRCTQRASHLAARTRRVVRVSTHSVRLRKTWTHRIESMCPQRFDRTSTDPLGSDPRSSRKRTNTSQTPQSQDLLAHVFLGTCLCLASGRNRSLRNALTTLKTRCHYTRNGTHRKAYGRAKNGNDAPSLDAGWKACPTSVESVAWKLHTAREIVFAAERLPGT